MYNTLELSSLTTRQKDPQTDFVTVGITRIEQIRNKRCFMKK